MATTLIDHDPIEKPIRQRPMLVIELVGPACAGKTTLTRALTQGTTKIRVAPDIFVRRPEHLAVFLRNAPRLLPVLLWGDRKSRSFTWEEVKSMVYLKAWTHVLTHSGADNNALLLLDQGPVFRLATLHAFGPDSVRKPAAARWWTARFQQWAPFLDLVVWLDAPDAILVKRINARARWHLVKGKSEQEASQFLDRYRASYRRVLTQLSVNGGPKIISFDTSLVSIDQVVKAILTVCNGVPDGG